MASKHVYAFGDGSAEAGHDKKLLGGKGAGLMEMSRLGVAGPPRFTITHEVCTFFQQHGGSYPEALAAQVEENLQLLEKRIGRRIGDAANPPLVSVPRRAR